jgi:hypothetical protein
VAFVSLGLGLSAAVLGLLFAGSWLVSWPICLSIYLYGWGLFAIVEAPQPWLHRTVWEGPG